MISKLISLMFFKLLPDISKKTVQIIKKPAPLIPKSCLDLHLSVFNNVVSTIIYDKRDNDHFPIFRFSLPYIIWSLYFST